MSHYLSAQNEKKYLLVPDRVFDGEQMYSNWSVVVQGAKIIAAGSSHSIKPSDHVEIIKLAGCTLLPD